MGSANETSEVLINQWSWSLRSIIVLIVCGSITILTVLGNGLILISVKLRFHARSYSDHFIVSLCLADFFVGLFVMPLMTIHSIHLNWPFHYQLCYLWMSIDFTCSTASFLTLASMALDRYYALTEPYFHLRNRSYASVLVCIIGSWAIPFIIWPSSIFLGDYFSVDKPSCAHPARPLVIVVLCIFFYYIPLLFMLVCYSKIIVNIKNIEVMIKGTCTTLKFSSKDLDPKITVRTNTVAYDNSGRIVSTDKQNHISTSLSAPSHSSLRSLILKYFQRKSSKRSPPMLDNRNSCPVQSTIIHRPMKRGPIENHGGVQNRLSPSPVHRSSRHGTTTATFTGHKRCSNENNEEIRSKSDLIINQNEEQLVRARLSTRTSSLPAARCVSYYYHHHHHHQNKLANPVQIIEDQQHHARLDSLSNERSRSQSHSSTSQGNANNGLATTDISEHSSSLENVPEEEHRRLNRRHHTSTSYNSNRYSQRAVAQFMHERNKARLRRNQKASRMLGILLAVFLVCWLPFTISYPTMMFYHNKNHELESIIFWFGYVNSLLNPFLYVYSSRNFRQAIMETLCCCARFKARQHLRYQ